MIKPTFMYWPASRYCSRWCWSGVVASTRSTGVLDMLAATRPETGFREHTGVGELSCSNGGGDENSSETVVYPLAAPGAVVRAGADPGPRKGPAGAAGPAETAGIPEEEVAWGKAPRDDDAGAEDGDWAVRDGPPRVRPAPPLP